MSFRQFVWVFGVSVLLAPQAAAQSFTPTYQWYRPVYRLWNDPPEPFVHPVDRHPFAGAPPLRLSFASGVFGLPAIRSCILNFHVQDTNREEAFYHLASRGAAAPPVLIALSKPNVLERRWELVLVSMMSGVMDRRMVDPLIHYVHHGSTPEVRSVALRGLARQLGNRALYTVSKATGPNRMQFRMGGSMTINTGEISYGHLLLPGDEKPIIRLFEELAAAPDRALRDQAKGLEWALRGVLSEQKLFQAEGYEIPWGSDGLKPVRASSVNP